MKTKLFFCLTILFLFGLCLPLYAQEWASTYGGSGYDYAWDVQQTSDGGYIVAGSTESFGSGDNSDFWVLKLDASGNVSWQRTYGGTGYDEADSVRQTSDGGYIVAGQTYSFGAGDSDNWVIKLDASGNVVWQRTYGGTGYDDAYSVQQTPDGGYIVAGDTESFGAGSGDVWVMKLDPSGNVVWQKTYGGTGYDEVNGLQLTPDGGYIVAGDTESFGAGDSDIWVIKLDSSGNVVWQMTYGGTDYDYASAAQLTTDGGYIVAGQTYSFGAGSSDVWVLKLNGSGNITGCSATGTSSATSAETNSVVGDVTASVAATSVTPQDSNADAVNTSVLNSQLCYAEPPSIPLPARQESFTYPASISPGLGENPTQINPIAFGTVATGGDFLRLQVGIYKFTSPVDMYLLFNLSTDPNTFYMVTAGNAVQVFAGALIPWKENLSTAINELIFGEVQKTLLPQAVYNVYLGVTPAGGTGLESFYLWATSFSVD